MTPQETKRLGAKLMRKAFELDHDEARLRAAAFRPLQAERLKTARMLLLAVGEELVREALRGRPKS